jgi:hypothetical protein
MSALPVEYLKNASVMLVLPCKAAQYKPLVRIPGLDTLAAYTDAVVVDISPESTMSLPPSGFPPAGVIAVGGASL